MGTILNAILSCIIYFCVRNFVLSSWLKTEQMDEAKYLEMERKFAQTKRKPFQILYRKMLLDFAEIYDLPKGFHVSTYVKACVRNVCTDLVEINFELWLVILGTDVLIDNLYLFVDYIQEGELNKNYATALFLIIVSVCITVFLFVILYDMIRIISIQSIGLFLVEPSQTYS